MLHRPWHRRRLRVGEMEARRQMRWHHVSRASPAGQRPRARHAAPRPGDGGVIAVAGAAGSGTASARRARAACFRPLPGRCPEVAPGAAAPGLAYESQLAVPAGGGIGAAMGVTEPADPGGDGDAAEIGGPLPANPIDTARSGEARDAARAAQEAAVSRSRAPARATSRLRLGARRGRRARRARTSRGFPAMTTRAFPPRGWQPPARLPTRSRTT